MGDPTPRTGGSSRSILAIGARWQNYTGRHAKPMTVTERAKEKLKTLLGSEVDDSSIGLRLETTPSGQFGVFPDRAHADDQVVVHEGAVVLLVDRDVVDTVGEATIDYEENQIGAQFVIRKG
jgi:Fe-S cluster assembly iron-binding protein IscA